MKSPTKNILIFGINYAPELTGIGRYTGEMTNWFSENGFHCNVVTSFPYYPNWKIQKPYKGHFYKKETLNDGNITLYRCPLYVPEKPSGLKRMIHEFTFFVSAFFVTVLLLFKPKNDFIFCIAPPFHLGFLGLFYRFFKGGKIIYHIQDLQIEAAKDLQIVKSNAVFRILFFLEAFILKRVDFISSISEGMITKIKLKIQKQVYLFPNWVEIDKFFPIINPSSLKPQWGFGQNDKIVLYSGSIGEKQGLKSLIDLACKFGEESNVKFIICGNGPYKYQLEEYAKEKGLRNLTFLPLQPHNVFNDFLNFADVHLVLQKSEAGDLVMPSKLTTILSAGGLVIATAMEGTSLYNDIVSNEMGVVVPPEDFNSLYYAIEKTCHQDYSKERLNARRYAEHKLNKDIILQNLYNSLLK